MLPIAEVFRRYGYEAAKFYSIAAGAGVVIAAMFATGTLTADIAVLVPVGSMIIANAMNSCPSSASKTKRFRVRGRRP